MSYRIDPVQAMVYQIRIKGHLGPQWAEWFGGLTITLEENGETLMGGPVAGQAALHGLLKKVRDLGLPLISAVRIEPARQWRETSTAIEVGHSNRIGIGRGCSHAGTGWP